MVDISGLKASRKADRQAIAAAFLAVAAKHGAQIEAKASAAFAGYHGAGIDLFGNINGVGFMLDIDDLHERHGSAGGLISWYNHGYDRPSRDFSPRFNAAAGEFSPYRGSHHKASSVGSWAKLLERFDAALAVAAEGAAFREREVA